MHTASRVVHVADALTAVAGEPVDKRTIAITNPIKALGSHDITVRLHDDVAASVSINVVPA